MNVLHYSFSLSACPKCHLLICKHTSLANLDFHTDQQQFSTTTSSSQQHLSDATNVYIFPSTNSINRYSWTTFGTKFHESIYTLSNLLSTNERTGDNIPFAEENIINSSLLLTPTIVRTQSERVNPLPIDLSLKNVSIPTIGHQSLSFSLFLLILLFLITNTIDIVLIYIYYHLHYIYFLSFLTTLVLCDMILWINNLIQSRTIPSYFLLIPFSIRFYLLYELLELVIIIVDRNDNQSLFHSLYKIKKPKLYQNLTLFYLTHTGFFSFINLYFWSSNFQFSTKVLLNMDYFIPQWLSNVHLSSTTDTISVADWHISDVIPASSVFVLISVLYTLIINYSLLSTFLIFKRMSFLMILSRLCLIIPRIYTLIFLFHLNTWWLSMTFLLVHLILMITLLFDRSKLQKTIFLQIIFSFITHQSIDDIAINALIVLENISIFLHRLYLETFSFDQITLRLIIFISILISLQMIGFLMNILSKHLRYRTKTIAK